MKRVTLKTKKKPTLTFTPKKSFKGNPRGKKLV